MKKMKIEQPGRILIVIGIIVLILLLAVNRWSEIEQQIYPEPVFEKTPADIHLYMFEDLLHQNKLNIEIIIINLGDKTAKDINIHVRSKDMNGTILFEGNITLTALILRPDEKASGTYTMSLTPYDAETQQYNIKHTIEISWDTGRTMYIKNTIL